MVQTQICEVEAQHRDIANGRRDWRLRLTWAQEWHLDVRGAECVMRGFGGLDRLCSSRYAGAQNPTPRWSPLNVPFDVDRSQCVRHSSSVAVDCFMRRQGLWNLFNFVTTRSGHQRPPQWDGTLFAQY